MAIRTASRAAPCVGDSAIRFSTYPLMRWTSSALAKKPEAISDSYCSRVMRYSRGFRAGGGDAIADMVTPLLLWPRPRPGIRAALWSPLFRTALLLAAFPGWPPECVLDLGHPEI